jgi:hypothetical protein
MSRSRRLSLAPALASQAPYPHPPLPPTRTTTTTPPPTTQGYDSAGFAVDGDVEGQVLICREVGKVAALRKKVYESSGITDFGKPFLNHTSMAHTRWWVSLPPPLFVGGGSIARHA